MPSHLGTSHGRLEVDPILGALIQDVTPPMDYRRILSVATGVTMSGVLEYEATRAPSASLETERAANAKRTTLTLTAPESKMYSLPVRGVESPADIIYASCSGEDRMEYYTRRGAKRAMALTHNRIVRDFKEFIIDGGWPTIPLAVLNGGGADWSDDTASRPKKDIYLLREMYRQNVYGITPDTLVIDEITAGQLAYNGEMRGLFIGRTAGGADVVEGVAGQLSTSAVIAALAEEFGISPERVIIASGQVDSANPAKPEALGDIWDTRFLWYGCTQGMTAPLVDSRGLAVERVAGVYGECMPPRAGTWDTPDGISRHVAVDYVGGPIVADTSAAILLTGMHG